MPPVRCGGHRPCCCVGWMHPTSPASTRTPRRPPRSSGPTSRRCVGGGRSRARFPTTFGRKAPPLGWFRGETRRGGSSEAASQPVQRPPGQAPTPKPGRCLLPVVNGQNAFMTHSHPTPMSGSTVGSTMLPRCLLLLEPDSVFSGIHRRKQGNPCRDRVSRARCEPGGSHRAHWERMDRASLW